MSKPTEYAMSSEEEEALEWFCIRICRPPSLPHLPFYDFESWEGEMTNQGEKGAPAWCMHEQTSHLKLTKIANIEYTEKNENQDFKG